MKLDLLHEAIWHGLHKVVLFLISEVQIDVNIRSTTINQRTPFANAASAGHLIILKELMKRGADYQSPDAKGYFPLHLAGQSFPEIVKYLINHCNTPINQRAKDKFGSTPFQTAILWNNVKVMKTLLELKADHRLTNLKNANSLDHIQKYNQKEAFIFLMKELNYDDIFTLYGSHGIHIAAELNLPHIIEYFVKERKVDINLAIRNEYGWTAFHIAVFQGSIAALKKLVELGADYQLPNKQGFYPIHLMQHEQTLDYLVQELHLDITQKSKETGETPFILAIKRDKTNIFYKLLALKADINVPEKKGWFPVQVAAMYGRNNMLSHLLEKKADINQLNENDNLGSTCLMQAVYNDNIRTTQLLLERKATLHQELSQAEGIKKLFDTIIKENPKNESLVLMAAQDVRTRSNIYQCAVERNLAWLTMATYLPYESQSAFNWGKKNSPEQFSLLCCIAAHYECAMFQLYMDKENCSPEVKKIIENDDFKNLAESKRQFLTTKEVMYYEILYVENIAKLIQKMHQAHMWIFFQLPNVLFDLVFDFIAETSLAKTKPVEILKAMRMRSGLPEVKDYTAQRALFFNKLIKKPVCNDEEKQALKRKYTA